MTTEVKAMVDSLPTVSHSVIDWKEAELVNKSDVLELIEKLTAWVKVEESTPMCFEAGDWDGKRSDIVLVKTREGETLTARLYNGILDGSEFNEWAEARYDYMIEVIEWKTII